MAGISLEALIVGTVRHGSTKYSLPADKCMTKGVEG